MLGNKEKLSYSELYKDSLKLARTLKETYGQKNNIILISPNSSFFLVAYLAILKSGNVCVPLSPSIEDHNLSYIVELTGAKIAFIASSLKDSKWDSIHNVYYDLPNIHNGDNGFSLDLFEEEEFDQDRLAEVIFTSGSTGEPKGVMITHKNLIANTDSILKYLQLTGDDVIEIVLPFYYCYGLSLLHTHMKVGGSIVLNNSFIFIGSVINDLKKYGCTGFSGVPSHFQVLLRKSKTFKTDSFPKLRYVTQAGGKLHNVFIEEFIEHFPDIDFYVMYGQTEATARLSFLPPHKVSEKMGSIGKAIPGVQLEIVNESGNIIQETDIVGELVAMGDNIMKGYLGDEKGSKDSLLNGWLHTGDLAYRDDDGFFYLTARKKEIIKVGGKRISPKEIEEVIVSIPGVVDCSIEGIFDDLLGEALKAEIVVSDMNNSAMNEMSIKKICAQKLAPEKVPQVIHFKKNLDIAATGRKTTTIRTRICWKFLKSL